MKIHIGSLNPQTLAPADPTQRRMADAAQKFEGLLLGQLLKPLRNAATPDADSEGDDADVLSSYRTEALADSIARNGGIGIAKRLTDHFATRKTPQKNQ